MAFYDDLKSRNAKVVKGAWEPFLEVHAKDTVASDGWFMIVTAIYIERYYFYDSDDGVNAVRKTWLYLQTTQTESLLNKSHWKTNLPSNKVVSFQMGSPSLKFTSNLPRRQGNASVMNYSKM